MGHWVARSCWYTSSIVKNKLWNLVGKQDYIINVQSPSNKSPVMGSFCETEYEIWTNLCRLDSLVHRRQKYGQYLILGVFGSDMF